MTETTTSRIHLPTAHELDSGGYSETSGWKCRLYLVPAAEHEDGIPAVEIHSGVGNIGWPVMAHNRRWLALGGYGPGVVGQSVLEQLKGQAGFLAELSGAYRGTEWDGSNLRGRWDEDEIDPRDPSLDIPDVEYAHCYWDAFEWFGPAGIHWEDLAREAKIDPERAAGDDWEQVAEQVAEIVEPLQDEQVKGTEAYARQMAEQWRDERAEEVAS